MNRRWLLPGALLVAFPLAACGSTDVPTAVSQPTSASSAATSPSETSTETATASPSESDTPAEAESPTPSETPTETATALHCSAKMSNTRPKQNSVVYLNVKTVAAASVSATAHYSSTDTTKTGKANGSGVASIAFRIGRASTSYEVVVEVTVTKGGDSGTCSTSFTPR